MKGKAAIPQPSTNKQREFYLIMPPETPGTDDRSETAPSMNL